MLGLRRVTPEDLPRLRRFWFEHWAGEDMIVHGEVFRPDELQGFVSEDWGGVATYRIQGGECEIISLNSLHEGQGSATALLNAVANEARRQGCRRVLLSTTNDNLHALGFYQKRGFELVRILRGAVNEARRIKPGIPRIGENGVPLRDEIELELSLPGQ